MANESAKGVWWVSYFVFYLENNKNLKTILTTIQPELFLTSFPKVAQVFSFSHVFFIFFFPIYHSLFFHPHVIFLLLAHFCPMCLCLLYFSHHAVQIIILSLWSLIMTRECVQLLISATRDDGQKEHRTSCSSPILTHNRYCPFPKALLPIKQAILWTASCNLLKVKLIYRQVLYVPICIL